MGIDLDNKMRITLPPIPDAAEGFEVWVGPANHTIFLDEMYLHKDPIPPRLVAIVRRDGVEYVGESSPQDLLKP